jgi:predicted transcriptional regulator
MLSSVLHPRHKLQYFKNAGWTDEWIEVAKALIREEFERSYASVDAEIGPTLVDVSTAILNCDNY